MTPHSHSPGLSCTAGNASAGSGWSGSMTTHDLFRAQEDATRVGVMRAGRLVHELSGPAVRTADLEKLYLEAIAA